MKRLKTWIFVLQKDRPFHIHLDVKKCSLVPKLKVSLSVFQRFPNGSIHFFTQVRIKSQNHGICKFLSFLCPHKSNFQVFFLLILFFFSFFWTHVCERDSKKKIVKQNFSELLLNIFLHAKFEYMCVILLRKFFIKKPLDFSVYDFFA